MIDPVRPKAQWIEGHHEGDEHVYYEGRSLMRVAVLSDIHGNPIALTAVLKDIEVQGGADLYLLLGDYAAIGYDPATVLDKVVVLPNAVYLRGNTDRYVVTGDRPPPTIEAVQGDFRLLPKLIQVAENFTWTQGFLAATGWLDWLAGLPLEHRLTLPGGTRVLCVHSSPGRDDGLGIHPALSDEEIWELTGDCDADLVLVGHTHWPLDRHIKGLRVINVGSVSNPVPPDTRASYVMLNANAAGYRVWFRRIIYDEQAVFDAITRARHPTGDFIRSLWAGEHLPPWWHKRRS
jgi:predicted phosphodiesterase